MLNSQLEILAQAREYLEHVSKNDYTDIVTPNFISSAGAHIRHILDHYLSIINGLENNLVDYDVRHRGNAIEHDPSEALKQLDDITEWISQLSPTTLNKNITLSTEISVSSKVIEKIPTSVARELIFAGSHAVHHYATIAQISFAQHASRSKLPCPPAFGIAPATATFIRQQKATS